MDRFIIRGGIPLKGEVTPSGNKNAALPLLAATILTTEPVILHNLPEINDVKTMRSLLESIGVEIIHLGNHSWKFHAKSIRSSDLDPELCSKIRASILLAGPILASSSSIRDLANVPDSNRPLESSAQAIPTLGSEPSLDPGLSRCKQTAAR